MSQMNEGGFSGFNGPHVSAHYKDQINPKNRGNPFIEALPDRIDIESFIDVLTSEPPKDPQFNQLPVEDRLELVQQIRPDFWAPFPSHYDKYRNLYSMIKLGYQSRNPLQAIYNRQFAVGIDNIFKAGVDDEGRNLAGNVHTSQSLVEIAINGFGKSQVYDRILNHLFPKVIHHSQYHGRALSTTQLVWLKVECPYNKSVGTFIKSFYAEVDKSLGTAFYEKWGEKPGTIDKRVMRMIQVAAQVNLGGLVIDEIQKIQKAYSGGEKNMIDFITQLVNTLGIPTILIGSFKALYLFKDSLANTRRGIPNGFAENISGHMLEDSWEWRYFLENLWDQQYTQTHTELTPDLREAMYFFSMGIPDFAVKLFMHVQSKAIVHGGAEKITVTQIREVAKVSLGLAQPIFEKIRSGDHSAYQDLEEIKPDWAPLNGYIQEASHRLSVHGSVAKDHVRVLQKNKKEEIITQFIDFAMQFGRSSTVAEAIVNQVYNASNGMSDLSLMYAQIAKLLLEKEEDSVKDKKSSTSRLPRKVKPPKIAHLYSSDDIRFVVTEGHKKGLTTEEALEQNGYIREVDELLNFISKKEGNA
ncbi:TniB family NTP-binding protein [Paenibacillus polymyxa]|uniref:TniB family NTP-binding protein n=1 Tax=Paenibacillus polymyxa TaxID=1406 RepID=UPI00234A147F|nr:TniB family NTP-binding protein [Paenibacillus polymyxa]WCM60710.1 TniB family NTP-binding protein [Paenibacillus polymyxa]